MSPSKPPAFNGFGLVIVLAAMLLGAISVLGVVFPEKAVLLHIPAIVLSMFFIGVGVAVMFGRVRECPEPKKVSP